MPSSDKNVGALASRVAARDAAGSSGQGLCAVARQADDATRFLVSDWHSGHLVTLNPDGRTANAGQIPNAVELASLAPEAINLSSQEWLVAVVCRELEFPNTNVLSCFRLGQNGELAGRQRFPGFEYHRSDAGNSWLFKASDGTIRFVANLGDSQAIPHSGVAWRAPVL